MLERQLRAEVEARQEALLRQAGHLGEAEPQLQRVALAVASLQGSVRRARAEIMEPYEQVGAQTQNARYVGKMAGVLRSQKVAGTCQTQHCTLSDTRSTSSTLHSPGCKSLA